MRSGEYAAGRPKFVVSPPNGGIVGESEADDAEDVDSARATGVTEAATAKGADGSVIVDPE